MVLTASEWTAFFSQEELAEMGHTKILPPTLDEALTELEADLEWAEKALGKEYVQFFLIVKRAEVKALSEMDVEARRKLMIQHF